MERDEKNLSISLRVAHPYPGPSGSFSPVFQRTRSDSGQWAKPRVRDFGPSVRRGKGPTLGHSSTEAETRNPKGAGVLPQDRPEWSGVHHSTTPPLRAFRESCHGR